MPHHNEKILIIKLGALGDFVQVLGAMKAIKQHHKNAHITLLTTKPFEGFGIKCGYFDDIWIDNKPKIFDIIGWLNLKKRLINGGFTRVYDLQNNDRTNLYFKLFQKNKQPEWVGTAKGASHQNKSKTRTAGHAFAGHKQTLALAGIEHIEIDDFSWINEGLSEFNLQSPYIIFAAGSAPQHPQKRWPAEKYGALANKLSSKGYQVILIGTKSEEDILQAIESTCPTAINLCGKTSLFQIAAIARGASASIGNDTGPMHIIAATGCPCITLFSAQSNPLRHAPMGKNTSVIQEHILTNLEIDKVEEQLSSLI